MGCSRKLGTALRFWCFTFLPPNCPMECSSSSVGSGARTHTRAVGHVQGGFRPSPAMVRMQNPDFFLANSLWPSPVGASLVVLTPPTCYCLTHPLHHPQHPSQPCLCPDSPESSGLASSPAARQRRTRAAAGPTSPAMARVLLAAAWSRWRQAPGRQHRDNGSLLCPAQVLWSGGHL